MLALNSTPKKIESPHRKKKGSNVPMATDCIGSEVAALVNGLKDGEVGGWVGERERDRERMYVYVYVWVGGRVRARA